jgi:hypothetical protein
MISSNPSG